MAISWSGYDLRGGDGTRAGIAVSTSAVSNSSASVTFTVSYYYGDYHLHIGNHQTATLAGPISGSVAFVNSGGTNGRVDGVAHLIATRTYTYTYASGSYGASPGSLTFGLSLSADYAGSTPSRSYRVAIPARPYAKPAAPSNVTLTRLSDSQARLQWARHSTAAAPYQGQQVILYTGINNPDGSHHFDSGRVVSNPTGAATSVVISGLSSNHIYGAHVRAKNSVGWSADPDSNWINTTPAAPPGVKAAVGAPDGAAIVVTGSIARAYQWSPGCAVNIQRSVNSIAYARVATGVQLPWTDTAPGAGVNQYQVQTVSKTLSPLTSAWVASNTVSTIVAPLAPSLLSPDGVTVDLDQDQTFSWQHNDGGDGAAATALRVQAFNESSAMVFDSGVVSSADPSFVLPGGTLPNGHTYGWAVADQGVPSKGFGPFSVLGYVTGSSAPTVSLTSPAGTLTTGHLAAAWSYSQAQGSPQAQAQLMLYAADGVSVLERGALTGTDGAYAFATYLENAVTYKLVLSVMSVAGVWASTSTTFTVSIPEPADVLATYEYDPLRGQTVVHLEAADPDPGSSGGGNLLVTESGGILTGSGSALTVNGNGTLSSDDPSLSVVDGAITYSGGGTPAQAVAVAASLDRSVDGGATWVRLADAVTLPVDFLDPLPNVAGQNLYRRYAISAEPAYKAMPVDTLHTPAGTTDGSNAGAWADPQRQWVFVSWGPAFTRQVRARSNPDLSETISAAGSVEALLSGGLGMPLFGDSVGSAYPVKVSALNAMPGDADAGYFEWDSDLADFRSMAREATVVCLRDMTGVRVFGTLRAGGGDIMSIDKSGPQRSDVSFTVTEARFRESYGAPELGDIPAGALRVADNGDGTWTLVDQSGRYLTAGSETWQMGVPS